MTVTGSEALLHRRLGRTEVRHALFGLVCLGCAVLLLALYRSDPEPAPVTAAIAVYALTAMFALGGLRYLYRAATATPRHNRLLRTLRDEPERVRRIYAAVMRPFPQVHRELIRAPEAEHMPAAAGGCFIVLELAPRSRLERILGAHRHPINARPDAIPALLAHLRAQAPNAQGPPPS